MSDSAAVSAAQTTCANSGNDVISCYPTAGTVAVQDESTSFVWNPKLPSFTQAGFVNVQLFYADGAQQIFNFSHVVNPNGQAGTVTVQVNDSWWGDRGGNWVGANISYPYYWLIATDGESPQDNTPQATFTAVQTTLAQSLRGTPTASTSTTASTPAQPTRKASHSRTALIAGVVVASLVVIVAGIVALFVVRRRRRASRRRAHQAHQMAVGAFVDPLPYEDRDVLSSKEALNAQMRAAHARLHDLRGPNAQGHTNPTSPVEGGGIDSNSDSELHRQIAVLTAEIERLRAMGAEEPPPYSLQPE
ncbi:hypothetical protein B0H11DRAFT_2143033 [Mycena galericulata]|nr:hypothetical protein B0H11DRAFT_2143033 [Mycena galericulata]